MLQERKQQMNDIPILSTNIDLRLKVFSNNSSVYFKDFEQTAPSVRVVVRNIKVSELLVKYRFHINTLVQCFYLEQMIKDTFVDRLINIQK